jgi:DNA ligase D-like protein (predicted polymerase)/DNA ligase D-like protein (predicted 3'-phosphoesterase)
MTNIGPGRTKFTNLQKVLFPGLNVTKHQVIEYYIRNAPRMLGFLSNRALTIYRSPDGVDKKGFYEKDSPKGKPSWVKTFRKHSETVNREIEYIVCNDVETLAWLANLAALEINIPLSKTNSIEHPDLVLLDLDPEPPADFDDAINVALLLKEKFDQLGLESYVKTSGKKGLHIILPIVPKYSFRQTRAFVHQMGKLLAKESDLIVSEFRQSRVPGTVYVDYIQNIRLKTMVCPYSLRANQLATVSTPLNWQEVEKGLKSEDFNIVTLLRRQKNPWTGVFDHRQTLDFENIIPKRRKTTLEKGEPIPAGLAEYVRKRNFTTTTEPLGQIIEDKSTIFVVQEHQARRLHYDLRLSREGVLKSWAIPKGIPEKHGLKRLAIQTEDHPLEYSEFEGSIPQGQYGAGTVKIWDKGSYKLKIWKEDMIEFLLKGGRLNDKYVLIKLKKSSQKSSVQKEWLLMKLKAK